MKVYLVGGAVRDKLLEYPVKERDWVVVGSTPYELINKNFQQVGKDFPVFIHPQTGEEYALARTERKKGAGYYGFICDFHPKVTLEEDLARRDLTINAMAMDDKGRVIDPFNGQEDLDAKILRHVSPAFIEDPVRVLRVARFAARYHHLGFTLANETRELMTQMVRLGELNHLVSERVWQEWAKSLTEKNPEIFIITLRSCGALQVILPELNNLFGVPNPPSFEVKIDSGIQMLSALQNVCKLTTEVEVRFAAALAGVGKEKTPMDEWPLHVNDAELGQSVIKVLCQRLRIPTRFKKLSLATCRFCSVLLMGQSLSVKERVDCLAEANAFRNPEGFEQLLIATAAQDMHQPEKKLKQLRDFWLAALEICHEVTASTIVSEGFQGKAVGEELHKRRVNRLQSALSKKS